jgi:hypothetical protein
MPFLAANFCQVVWAAGVGRGCVGGVLVMGFSHLFDFGEEGGERHTFSLGILDSIAGSDSNTPLGVDVIGHVLSN